MTSLFEALPAEIILQIHLLSTSSALPGVSQYIHSVINSSATPSYRAQWLSLRLAREGYAPAPSVSTCAKHDDHTNRHNFQTRVARRRLQRNLKYRSCLSDTGQGVNHDPVAGSSTGLSLSPELMDASFLNKALKYPICNLDTILLLEKQCLDHLNDRLQAKYHQVHQVKRNGSGLKGYQRIGGGFGRNATAGGSASCIVRNQDNAEEANQPRSAIPPPPPYPTFLPLPPKTIDLPKRLFRKLGSSPSRAQSPSTSLQSSNVSITTTTSSPTFDSHDLPLLLHILTRLQGNPNSNKGYALAKSVLSRHLFLIEILLEHGADPSVKDYMAVMLAIGRKDMEIVRMLVERQQHDTSVLSIGKGSISASFPPVETGIGGDGLHGPNHQDSAGNSRKRKRGGREGGASLSSLASSCSPSKKRKVEDRFQVTSEMLELAVKLEYEPLIQFFMAKGAVPNLKTLQMLQM